MKDVGLYSPTWDLTPLRICGLPRSMWAFYVCFTLMTMQKLAIKSIYSCPGLCDNWGHLIVLAVFGICVHSCTLGNILRFWNSFALWLMILWLSDKCRSVAQSINRGTQVFIWAGCSRIWSSLNVTLDRILRWNQVPLPNTCPPARSTSMTTAVSLLPLGTDAKGRTHTQGQGFPSGSEWRILAGFLLTGLLVGTYRGNSLSKSSGVSQSWVSQQAGEDYMTTRLHDNMC